jgi:tetratricopeptide (TPR) repeat protein
MNSAATESPQGGTHDVFISYAHPDSDIARELTLRLRRLGLSVFDVQSDVPVGSNFSQELASAIVSSKATVALVSPDYVKGNWARFELELARESAESSQTLLIPVVLPGTDWGLMPKELRQFHGVKIEDRGALDGLAAQIFQALERQYEPPESDQRRSADLLRQALADSERVLGPDHPSTLSTRANLANVFIQLGRLEEATDLLRQTLADSERVLGPDHPSTLSTRANLANVFIEQGRLEEAADLLRQTLADSERVLGPDHPSTLSTRANLANVFIEQGRLEEAADLLRQTLADSERILGPDHPLTQMLSARVASLHGPLGGAS